MLVALSSEEIVLLLFGKRWGQAAPLVKLFAVYASFNCFNLFHDSFLTSQGRTDLLIKVNMVEKTVLVVAVLVALYNFGLYGIVVAKTMTTFIFFFLRLSKACRLVNLSMFDWFAGQRRIALSLFLSFCIAFMLKLFLPVDSFLVRLILVTGAGWLVFYAGLIFFKEPSLLPIKKIIIDQLRYPENRKKTLDE